VGPSGMQISLCLFCHINRPLLPINRSLLTHTHISAHRRPPISSHQRPQLQGTIAIEHARLRGHCVAPDSTCEHASARTHTHTRHTRTPMHTGNVAPAHACTQVRIQATRALRELQTAEFFGSYEAMVDAWHWAVQAAEQQVQLVDPSNYKYKNTLQREQRVCVVVFTRLVGEARGLRKEDQAQIDAEAGAGDGTEAAVAIAWTEARTVMGCILQVSALVRPHPHTRASCRHARARINLFPSRRLCACECVRACVHVRPSLRPSVRPCVRARACVYTYCIHMCAGTQVTLRLAVDALRHSVASRVGLCLLRGRSARDASLLQGRGR